MGTNNDLPDNRVFFNFGYLTGNRRYNIDGFRSKKKSGQEERELLELLEHLQIWSLSSFNQLKTRGKHEDGLELMEVREFEREVFDRFPEPLDAKRQAAVFRFADYRMCCLFDEADENQLYVFAFDWDYTLYNHGS